MKIEKIELEMTHWMFSFSGVLTIAVTWCPLSNACLTTSFPVLPVAPNTTNLNFLEGEISSPEAAMFDPYVTPLFPRPLSEWRRYHGDMRIPIPKTLVIWASPVTLTLIAKVIWEGDAHITSVLEMGMPISLTAAKTILPRRRTPYTSPFARGKIGENAIFSGTCFPTGVCIRATTPLHVIVISYPDLGTRLLWTRTEK